MQCRDDFYSTVRDKALKGGSITVCHTHGRNGPYHPHLPLSAPSGGYDGQGERWEPIHDWPYELLRRKWQRWYVAYPLSYRHVEELMEERGVPVDHATIQRWVVKYNPQLETAFHCRKRPVWVSWRMDETYIRVKGQWYYLYRAVDKTGQTIDFLLTK
jgi:DDE domain/Putative transposase